MGIFRTVIYDNDQKRISELEYVIKSIALKRNWKEFAVMKISNELNEQKALDFVEDSHFIFVQFNMPNAINFAEKTRRKNMFCKIIFYNFDKNADINSVLKCSPFACLENIRGSNSVENAINNCLNLPADESNILFFENRKTMLFVPIDKVIYFCSDQHYINVIYKDAQGADRFKDKLDNVEAKISSQIFVRIHKSFFISLLHISKIDKVSHIIIMDNDDALPISDSYYKNAITKLRQLCSLKP